MACTIPKETAIDTAVKSLKELGALTMYQSENIQGRNPLVEIDTTEEKEKAELKNRGKLKETDLKDGRLTPMGRLMAALPLDLNLSRMVYFGCCMGLAEEAIIIAACTETQIWLDFHRDAFSHEETALGSIAQLKRKTFFAAGSQSDHIASLNAFVTWISMMPENFRVNEGLRHHEYYQLNGRYSGPRKSQKFMVDEDQERAWCEKMGLNRRRLRDASKCVDDLKKRLIRLGYFYGNKGSKENVDHQDVFLEFNKDLIGRMKRYPNDTEYATLLKVMIAGGNYPYFFKFDKKSSEEDDCMHMMKLFNPLTTVYLNGLPQDRAFKYGKDLYQKMSRCGTVKRMYFHKSTVFVEFDRIADLADIYTLNSGRQHELEAVKRAMVSGNSIVTPSVIFALKSSRRNASSSQMLKVYGSHAFQAADDSVGDLYYIKFDKDQHKRYFPRRHLDAQTYEVEITAIYGITIFYAVRIEDIDLRAKIDSTIDELYRNNQLSAVVGQPKPGAMILAPFEDDGNISYHRAVVVKSITRHKTDQSMIQFCEYGNIEVSESSRFFHIPDEKVDDFGTLASIPILAVKYRLRGVRSLRKYYSYFYNRSITTTPSRENTTVLYQYGSGTAEV